MKKIPFKLVKKNALQKIQDDAEAKEKVIISATEFVKQIENGNLDVLYNGEEKIDEDTTGNALAASLISMRDQMKKIARQESERKWVTEGLARFVEILRANNDMEQLADNIIKNLVKYLNANQGMLFLLSEEENGDRYLEIIGCYAYERKKYIYKRINIGEGVAGQSVLEKETIYMTEIPKNYVNITSGLGEAAPSSVLIVPLKVNEVVYGVVEIASFTKLAQYQIEFVEKLGESIASSISTVKNADRTKKLLEESQSQAEQVRAQEEELRQNMEELSSTQEEIQRVLKMSLEKEAYIQSLIDATDDAVVAVDKDMSIVIYNTALEGFFKDMGKTVRKGYNMKDFLNKENIEKQIEIYDRTFAGEHFKLRKNYGKHVVDIKYDPIRNRDTGEIIGVSCFTRDVSEQLQLQEDLERKLKEVEIKKRSMEALEHSISLTMLLCESDDKGNILFVNNKWCEISGYSEEELYGKSQSILFDVPSAFMQNFEETIKTGNPFKGIIKNKSKNGEHYWVDASVVPVKDEHNKCLKYVTTQYYIAESALGESLYLRQFERSGLVMV